MRVCSAVFSVFSSALPNQARVSGWKLFSTPRMAERGRRAPLATMLTRPNSRVNVSRIRLVSLYGYVCKMKAASESPRPALVMAVVRASSFVAVLAHHSVVVRPALLYAHPKLEVDLPAQELLEIEAGLGADLLQLLSALA